MALQKRNSNPIHIDGVDLRWTVSLRDPSLPGSGMLVVQADSGQRLVVRLQLSDLWVQGYDANRRYAITPELVRRVVLEAQALGWTPEQSGPSWNGILDEDERFHRARVA